MTVADALPISQSRAKQLTDFLATPKTVEQVAEAAFASWFRADRESGLGRAQDLIDQLCEQGSIRPTEDGKYEAVPVTEDPDDDGAQPTGGAAESDSTEQSEMTTQAAPKKRGRPPKAATNRAPAAAPASKPKAQGSVLKNEEISDHLGAIERVETELAEAKISYEDTLNVRRMKRAALDVAKSERRRFSVHDGSNLDQIKAAQKSVDKAQKQYNEAAANALEAKNKVNSVEEKLSRTIAGEMPLFNEGVERPDGDDKE